MNYIANCINNLDDDVLANICRTPVEDIFCISVDKGVAKIKSGKVLTAAYQGLNSQLIQQNRPIISYIQKLSKFSDAHANSFLSDLWMAANAINYGVKEIRPTQEQISIFSTVELTTTVENYKQPYKFLNIAFNVDGPSDLAMLIRKSIDAMDYGHDSPFKKHNYTCGLTLYQHEQYLFFSLILRSPDNQYVYFPGWYVDMSNQNVELESLLKDLGSNAIFTRLAINLMLWATNYGYTEIPQSTKRNKSNKTDLRSRIKRRIVPQGILLQTVNLTQHRHPHQPSEETQEYTTKRPHWRRGYWRNQPYGKGRQHRKLIFIAESLVNRKLLNSVSDAPFVIMADQK